MATNPTETMNPKILALVALPLLAHAAHAGDVRVLLRGTVSTASNPNGAYAGVQLNDPVELSCELFLTSPPPVVVAPGQWVNYAIDTTTMTMSLGAVNVPYTGGAPVFGMVDAFPVSDGVQGPNAQMGAKNLSTSINHNGALWTSVNPLHNVGVHPIVIDGSFAFTFTVTGGGTFLEIFPTEIVVERLEAGPPFCPGDGSGAACPCGNSSSVGADVGCLSSLGQGGSLRGVGIASLANDSVVLEGTQMPNSSALYFQGTNPQAGGLGTPFGDGLRCAGGVIVRLGTKTNVGGASQYPAAGDPSVSVRGGIVAPGTFYYQVWYRNAAAFCTASTFNLTNGVTIVWS